MPEVTKLNDGPTRLFNDGIAVGKPQRVRLDLEAVARMYGIKTLVSAMLDDRGGLILEGVK